MHKNGLPLIIAHRGSSFNVPENTLEAFNTAIEEGSDGIELDVRLSKDGVPMVFHDGTTKRFTGREYRIAEMDADAVKEIPVGKWFNNRFPKRARHNFQNIGVPTLSELLDELSDFNGIIYVELKCADGEAEKAAEAAADVLVNAGLTSRFIVKSFNLDTIPVLQKLRPELKTAALFAPKVMSVIRKEKRLVNIAEDLGAESLSIHSSLATKKLLRRSAKKGLNVAIWTVDRSRWVKRSVELGIDTIITNRPAKMILARRQLLHRNSITA